MIRVQLPNAVPEAQANPSGSVLVPMTTVNGSVCVDGRWLVLPRDGLFLQ